MTFFKISVKQKCTQLTNKQYTHTGGLEPKCVLKLSLGSLVGTRVSAVGHFCPLPSKSPRSLCETYLAHFRSGFQSSELLPKKSNVTLACFRARG